MTTIVFNEFLCNTVIYDVVMEFDGVHLDDINTTDVVNSCKKKAEMIGFDWKELFNEVIKYIVKLVELEEK